MAMAAIITVENESIDLCVVGSVFTRKEKRKAAKKQKRKKLRINNALKEIEEEKSRMNDPKEQEMMRLMEEEENRRSASAIKEYEERERVWIQAMEKRKEVQEEQLLKKIMEDSEREKVGNGGEVEGEEEGLGFVEEGPAEIIWQGNEIIVKKKRVTASKKGMEQEHTKEDADRPTSNPLPPQSEVFFDYNNSSLHLDERSPDLDVQHNPNFGTEQDKSHCPFHFKTGACRFGQRCNRAHFYPEKSCTLLIKNMYNGPGLAWEQDEGLEVCNRCCNIIVCTDEEIECSYEEFYEDVHTEFLKFGEIVNFKVCKNGSFHLRGNVYVQYVSLDSATQAFQWMNGRYFAGKQVSCEYISVMKWKVAICGEYLKTRMKTCSHGSACNFIHCFRNPCGDYEWADWDNPPPSYWVTKMSALFGPSRPLHPLPPYHTPTKKSGSRSTDRVRHGHRRRRDADGDSYNGSYADHHRRHRHEDRGSEKRKNSRGENVLFEGVERNRKKRR